jgi:hypothetical protein
MWRLSQAGVVPRQHIWGVDALAAAGHIVDFAPFHEPGDRNLLDRLSNRSRRLLGHLDQEAYAIRGITKTDVLYCADQTGLAGLALASRAIPRTRLISVVHHPVRHAIRRAAAARHDVLVCLSAVLCSELSRDLPRPTPTIVQLPWGPDLSSPLYRTAGEENGVVSAGKSNRDLTTLARALARTDASGVVYDLERQLPAPPTGTVRLVHPGDRIGADPDSPGGYLAHHVIGETAAASVVAIPVRDPQRLTGLTEVASMAGPQRSPRCSPTPIGVPRWAPPGAGSPSSTGTTQLSAPG